MAVLWGVRAWLSIFTRPLAAILVIVLFGMMSGPGRAQMAEEGGGGSATWTKASKKAQLLAVINDTAGFKVAPLAKTPKAVWYEFAADKALTVVRPLRSHESRVVLRAPELPSCPWVGVIVLRV